MLTRRDFLTRLGQPGGYGVAFAAMNPLGLIPPASTAAGQVDLPTGSGKGLKVVILADGIAGPARR